MSKIAELVKLSKKDNVHLGGKERQAKTSVVRDATFDDIPLISLDQSNSNVVSEIKKACTTVGFFYIKDHGVPQESIDKVLSASQKFFALPSDAKNEIHFSKSKHLRGYERAGDNVISGTKPDLNEQFSWGYNPSLDPERTPQEIEEYESDAAKNFMFGPNFWPESVPEMESSIKEYYGHILGLARRLSKLFAQSLDLPANYFDKMFKTPGAMGRVLHYFPQEPTDESQYGISAHTDIECFTILHQGQVPALQVLAPDGQWVQALPIKGTFVINVGDLLARWSNDVFTSAVHRVVNLSGVERYSMPVFIGVDYETMVEPLSTCLGASGAKYDPVKAGDYVFMRLAHSRVAKEDLDGTLKAVAA